MSRGTSDIPASPSPLGDEGVETRSFTDDRVKSQSEAMQLWCPQSRVSYASNVAHTVSHSANRFRAKANYDAKPPNA